MRNIAIFASGSGTNAENIIKYFSNRKTAKVTLVLSNRREAFVLKRAAENNVKSVFFDRNEFYNSGIVLDTLISNDIDFIVLAGFLWLVPDDILTHYNGRIINIHPALLPKYGGRGFYGEKVHKAVISNHETESGITIHHVNKFYDEGDIIFQAKCKVEPSDTPESLAARIHRLEYEHFPRIIEKMISELDSNVR
ncbi:MAG: phosphoribosylglycinamide formyltransferase [Bacteroidales bacterium]|jgi:phosphoribosylglycinamide formyltransferase-1|nr:phosphoribosylglycinamide formyltransferase [Bacteroidales bacterium]OQB62343.1 MAG: Phosphoribosylglycinamide formyltransferase [Bacteroidetes bacterium ADurb.Bin145]HOU02503.1 phosphoribosylglycinamide formyltransferase [Bacteroidales bacterium]HQK67857.1 phosphoribosylglycinamide formyltransferase [Bacteroidales bacterium]